MAAATTTDVIKVRDAFFFDVAERLDYWSSEVAKDLGSGSSEISFRDCGATFKLMQDALRSNGLSERDIQSVLFEVLTKFMHSVFAVLDGATSVAELSRLHVTCESGDNLGEGLGLEFYSYLAQTGRIKAHGLPPDYDPSKY